MKLAAARRPAGPALESTRMSDGIDRRTLLGGTSAAVFMALLRSSYAAGPAGSAATTATVTPHAPGGLGRESQRAFSANQTITTLVPGRLYRVGCVVRAERLSWLPADLDDMSR